MGRPFGAAVALRKFDREDWTKFNRLSFWVYPDLPGFRIVSMCVVLRNAGAEKVPGPYDRNGRNYILLKNHQWNHCVWEIAHLGRDAVTGVELIYRQQGNEPCATNYVTFDFDQLELQKVNPDHFEGWNVAPGQIAFSHSGYLPQYAKIALASNLDAKEFSLVDATSGAAVLTKPIRKETHPTGTFQVLDFTEIQTAGDYRIRAGAVETRPFRIAPDVWRNAMLKTINFYYTERCGDAIPGIHDVCHRDWICEHGDKKIVINGGWHDAGDLSQGLVNTAESAYELFRLAEAFRDSDLDLAQRAMTEARWGLDWILKTRFGDGFRCRWAVMDFWTDGILGNVDDVTYEARDNCFENYLAASTEALAARLLQPIDPIRAREALLAAIEDWEFARAKLADDQLELVAAGLNASLDLYETTQEAPYLDEAARLADIVVECQQVEPHAELRLQGFFYTGPDKRRILHYAHRSHEQAPVIGLARICELIPDRANKWRRPLALYCNYYKSISRHTRPWGMIPAGIYALDGSDKPTYREQVKEGVRLGENYYLRCFPVWYMFRGNHGTALSTAAGLAAAAKLLGDQELLELLQLQLQWVVGRNPFCQSTMWGEGYDFAPQYTAMSGDLVGSLPVGIQTHFEKDVPYWPTDNCYNWKEVWVHPTARWLSLMVELGR